MEREIKMVFQKIRKYLNRNLHTSENWTALIGLHIQGVGKVNKTLTNTSHHQPIFILSFSLFLFPIEINLHA